LTRRRGRAIVVADRLRAPSALGRRPWTAAVAASPWMPAKPWPVPAACLAVQGSNPTGSKRRECPGSGTEGGACSMDLDDHLHHRLTRLEVVRTWTVRVSVA
jgi:hypothetical protein